MKEGKKYNKSIAARAGSRTTCARMEFTRRFIMKGFYVLSLNVCILWQVGRVERNQWTTTLEPTASERHKRGKFSGCLFQIIDGPALWLATKLDPWSIGPLTIQSLNPVTGKKA